MNSEELIEASAWEIVKGFLLMMGIFGAGILAVILY
jgi:hypothetical protein